MSQLTAAERALPSDKTIQSVDRALGILEAMARKRGEVTLSYISDELGLNVSTCHHIIKTLIAHKYVRPGAGRGRYVLGSQLVVLADAVDVKAELPGRARPVLEALNNTTEEAVHLAVLEADEMITLVKLEARHALRIDSGSIGKSRALHATATGKVLLSGLDNADVRRITAEHGMRTFTPRTCTDVEVLLDELALIRERGYAEDEEEFQRYVVCIGAAVLDTAGRIIASISVSVPINRATTEHLEMVRGEVMAAGRALSLSPHEPNARGLKQ